MITTTKNITDKAAIVARATFAGFGKVLLITLLSIIVNWIFTVMQISQLSETGGGIWWKILILIVVFAIAFPVLAGIISFKKSIVDKLKYLYNNLLNKLLEKACLTIVQKMKEQSQKKEALDAGSFQKAFRLGTLFDDTLQSLPGILRVPAQLLLDQIPLWMIMQPVLPSIANDAPDEEIAKQLYLSIDTYMNEELLAPDYILLIIMAVANIVAIVGAVVSGVF